MSPTDLSFWHNQAWSYIRSAGYVRSLSGEVAFSSSERPKLNFSNSKMVKIVKHGISLKPSLLVLVDWKYVLGASLSRLVLSGAIRAPQDDFVNPSFA